MEEEKLVNIAMQIILNAGDARTFVKEALDAAVNDNVNLSQSKMKEAQSCIEEAHKYQTKIIQEEAAGNKIQYSMLFTHAQDTLMTIYSELHIARQIITMYEKLTAKIEGK